MGRKCFRNKKQRRLLPTSRNIAVQVPVRVQWGTAADAGQGRHVLQDVVLLLRLQTSQRSKAVSHSVVEKRVNEGPPGAKLKERKYFGSNLFYKF